MASPAAADRSAWTAARSASVIPRTVPSASVKCVQRSRITSARPFTSAVSTPFHSTTLVIRLCSLLNAARYKTG